MLNESADGFRGYVDRDQPLLSEGADELYEYFHGDNGAGLGANHQTGWTGSIARVMHLFATLKPELLLEGGRRAAFERQVEAQSGQAGDAARRRGR